MVFQNIKQQYCAQKLPVLTLLNPPPLGWTNLDKPYIWDSDSINLMHNTLQSLA